MSSKKSPPPAGSRIPSSLEAIARQLVADLTATERFGPQSLALQDAVGKLHADPLGKLVMAAIAAGQITNGTAASMQYQAAVHDARNEADAIRDTESGLPAEAPPPTPAKVMEALDAVMKPAGLWLSLHEEQRDSQQREVCKETRKALKLAQDARDGLARRREAERALPRAVPPGRLVEALDAAMRPAGLYLAHNEEQVDDHQKQSYRDTARALRLATEARSALARQQEAACPST